MRLKRGSQVVINQGLYKGRIGWVNRIEVEHTKDTVYAIVFIHVELAQPYGAEILVTSAMVDL